jgi:hypothetical protein
MYRIVMTMMTRIPRSNMQLTIHQFKGLAQIVAGVEKQAQFGGPKRKRSPVSEILDSGHPDYGRSLVSQNKRDPHTAGVVRGAAGGVTGAVLLALLARMITDKRENIGRAAVAGGLVGGGAGYLSGRREAESEHTKSLALRRLGINNPAELLVTQLTPSLTHRMVGGGGMSEVL